MQFSVDFCAHRSVTLNSTRLLVHVNPNFNPGGCIICG